MVYSRPLRDGNGYDKSKFEVRTRQSTRESRHNCLDLLDYREDEDRAKSAYSRIALIKRGLRAAAVSANRIQLGNVEDVAAAAACGN